MGSRHAAKAPEPRASSKKPKVRGRDPPSSLLFSPSVLGLSGASLSLVVGVAPSDELSGLLGSLPLLPELNLRASMGRFLKEPWPLIQGTVCCPQSLKIAKK
jgi:hypothetical protein